MKAIKTLEDVAALIRETINADFKNVTITDVKVLNANEFDTDSNVMTIEVTFEGEAKNVTPKSVAGAVRHIRPKLIEAGEDRFPVFSFIPNGEAGTLEPA